MLGFRLSLILVLVPALALAAAPPPADLTGDGVPDHVYSASDGGSGFSWRLDCVTDGATGRTLCAEVAETAYSPFAGVRFTVDGSSASPSVAAVEPLGLLVFPWTCAPPDPTRPSQGAMWRLSAPSPGGGVMDLPPLRIPGPPPAQERVCMAPATASSLGGAFTWDAPGTMDAARASDEGWLVAYLFAGPPTVELEAGPLVFFRSHAAIAVWHREADVHGWLVNLADGSDEGFKIDRWTRLQGFRQDGESVSVKVAHAGLPARLVIDLRTWRP
jgi:hypothetical protein